MLRKLVTLFILTALGSSAAFSQDESHGYLHEQFLSLLTTSFVATLSGGLSWPYSTDTQSLILAPGIEKTYTASQSANAIKEGELFAGVQRMLKPHWQTQIGFALFAADNARLSGQIWDDANPAFNNLSYQYQIRHTHVAIKGKLLADYFCQIIPWASVSVGIGFNDAYQFSNTPLIFAAVPNPNFASQTTTTLTYTLGIGLQSVLTKNWQVGLGYEFADWGKSQLGRAAGQTIGKGLTQSHFYTSGFLANLTYLN